MPRVAFVTEELSNLGRSGGIGAAIYELAASLADRDVDVEIIFFPHEEMAKERKEAAAESFAKLGIKLKFIDPSNYVYDTLNVRNRSYCVFAALREQTEEYDFIHFHDYKGLGYFCTAAKRQNVAFQSTTLVVQLHGPLRWTLSANRSLFTHIDQLSIDFMERESIRMADHVVSPSQYLVSWLKEHNFQLPPDDCVHVIKNVCSYFQFDVDPKAECKAVDVKEVIFFGRHEARKGIVTFCDALDLAEPELTAEGIRVTFLGGLGEVNGISSGVYLTDKALKWKFKLRALVNLNREEAMAYLASRDNAIVVIPSSAENSPYTVVEAMSVGRPILTSSAGGGKELIDKEFHGEAVVDAEPEAIADRLISLARNGVQTPRPAESADTIINQWVEFHRSKHNTSPIAASPVTHPKVVVGITHFERPRKVIGAILSVLRQTYDNIEVVVVDDGSRSNETLDALDQIEKLLVRVGGRLIRRENGYLGAARNTIANQTNSEFLLFLDDDDLLLPDAVQKLVHVATSTNADIVNCFNYYMDAAERSKYEVAPESMVAKVAYVPIGGPLSIAHLSNVYGAATAIIKRSFFESIGGYTEKRRVGYEDYELYVRAAQHNADIRIIPEVLYLYEVNKPSMISGTSRFANKARVIDAIEMRLSHSQWHDAISLAAGQECIVDEMNYNNWRMSISPFSEQLQKIQTTRNDLPLHLSALHEYAAAIGSPAASMWVSAMDKTANALAQDDETEATYRTVGDNPAASLEGEIGVLAELIASWKLKPADEGAADLIRHVEFTADVSELVIDFAFLFAASQDLSIARAAAVAESLDRAKARVSGERAVKLQGAIIALETAAGQIVKAKSRFSRLIQEEAHAYVQRHPDLRIALRKPAIQGFKHFQRYGKDEGREGFTVLRKVADAISLRTGAEVNYLHLSEDLDRMCSTSTRKLSRMRRFLPFAK